MSWTGRTEWKCLWIAGLCLVLAQSDLFAQKKTAATTPETVRKVLIDKARILESRGRPDMAIQLWQQVLLSDPKNTEALAGIARDYKLTGKADQSAEALGKLRQANPNDPNIAKIAQLNSTRTESTRLRQAGELAKQGKNDEAMRIYRELYGEHPPDGEIALAYYQTLYGTATGKEQAVRSMRALSQRNPGDGRFAVELGTMLTYDARTRAEGIRILREHPQEANAQMALRQALLWDAANPSTAGALRQFLKEHPQDQEVALRLKEDEAQLAKINAGLARNAEERAAFAALNSHHPEEAEKRFRALLDSDSKNSRAQAGLGFLRMQENNFGEAISYLTQAQENGFHDRTVESALESSRFWFTLSEASQALDDHQTELAASKYKKALEMRPNSPEALSGMAGLMLRERQYASASSIYEGLVKQKPASSDNWRGLFQSYAQGSQPQKALDVAQRFPPAVRSELSKDPEYLRTLAAVDHALGREEEARRALELALSLPFPGDGTMKTETSLQYAALLSDAGHTSQAEALYEKILSEDPNNLNAWEGKIGAHHSAGKDSDAIHDVETMPAAVYESAIADPAFLEMLAGIYQQANQLDVAVGFLERAIRMTTEGGHPPTEAMQLQLAGLYLARNDSEKSYALYRKLLDLHPDSEPAWKGLIISMIQTHHEAEALQELAQVPPAVRKNLESDIEFVQSEASAQAAVGDTARAVLSMNRVLNHYSLAHTNPPAQVEVQNAWMLYNTRNDRALYPALMHLGSRQDLNDKQRETVQSIWASWAVRRAGVAIENHNPQRALDILDAAAAAFPENMTVRRAVAGGYAQAGRARDAVTIFKTIPMQDASATDFQSAVGAALAANDRTTAELWLRQALERFPRNPSILQMAAHYEQARGDSQRAADYYRASLAAMPKVSPANRLAHVLVNPEEDTRVRRANTPADLERILDPQYEPFPRVAKLPPLPSYGADPANAAPVMTQGTAEANPAPQNDWTEKSTSSSVPVQENSRSAEHSESQLPEQSQRLLPATGSLARMKDSDNSFVGKKNGGQMHLAASSHAISGTPSAEEYSELAADHDQASRSESDLSMATDAWKGLLSSLLTVNKTEEAQKQYAQIPPAIRRQLENDMEFLQIQADLCDRSGDSACATAAMQKVIQDFAERRKSLSASAALINARIIFHAGNDRELFAVLEYLENHKDMSVPQKQQVEILWAGFAVRTAIADMQKGNSQRGLKILDAALAQYPTSNSARLVIASGYARIGRSTEAMEIYRKSALQQASAETLQGAISAAIAAGDMKQADLWLHQALTAYPKDAGVLAAASRYEQMKGNQTMAAEYWKAAVAAVPSGTSLQKYDSLPIDMGQTPARSNAHPGELKKLLNPDSQQSHPSQLENPKANEETSPQISGGPSLRLSAEPMAKTAANAHALFAEQTDGQLTQGAAANINALPAPQVDSGSGQQTEAATHFALTQYTPSAQEAVTGAFSANPSQGTQKPGEAAQPAEKKKKSLKKVQPAVTEKPERSAPTEETLPATVNAPATLPTASKDSTELPAAPAPVTSQGLTDEELQQRDLPPLRGPWVRVQRQKRELSPRDEAEQQLRTIESSYSGWLGGSGIVNYRSGTLGYDQLAALEAPIELSVPVGYTARFTVIARPVFLDSGQADGNAQLTVQEQTTSGTVLTTINEPIGTLIPTTTEIPTQQNASGLGGEVQLAWKNFAIAGGYTPYGFLVSTPIARLAWKPGNGPFTFNFNRDSVKDTELSYGGLRDPAGNTLGTSGNIWGGVVANAGNVQFAKGDAQSGFYLGGGFQYLSGYNVQTNQRVEGSGGAYWRALALPEYGNLNIGTNFFAMHYSHNENAFTYGMGGYFSPQAYFLANVPISWTGHYGTKWHYDILGSMGLQAFQEDKTLLWPLKGNNNLEVSYGNIALPAKTSVGANYDFRSHLAYQVGPHWFVGGFLSANNSRNYSSASAGFSIRYLFRAQPSTVSGPTGLLPTDGLRPLNMP